MHRNEDRREKNIEVNFKRQQKKMINSQCYENLNKNVVWFTVLKTSKEGKKTPCWLESFILKNIRISWCSKSKLFIRLDECRANGMATVIEYLLDATTV